MIFSAFILQAQNLMLNGGLEDWSDDTTPVDWDKAENVLKTSGAIVYEGSFCAAQTAGTKDLTQNVEGISGGTAYYISYMFFDSAQNAKSRIWSYWLEGSTTLNDNAAELRPSTYSENDTVWQYWADTLIAPANADGLRFEVRTYNDNDGGGIIYYDDFQVQAMSAVPVEITEAYMRHTERVQVAFNQQLPEMPQPSDFQIKGGAYQANITDVAQVPGNNLAYWLTVDDVPDFADLTPDTLIYISGSEQSSYLFNMGFAFMKHMNTAYPAGHYENDIYLTFHAEIIANDNYNSLFYRVDTGAYESVMIYSNSLVNELEVGQTAYIIGKRTVYNGITEITDNILDSVYTDPDFYPFPSYFTWAADIDETIGDDQNPAEQWESQFINIFNFTVVSYDNYDYRCRSNDDTTVFFHIGDGIDYQFSNTPNIEVGQSYFSINGIVDWDNNNGYYRINPRSWVDVHQTDEQRVHIAGDFNGWSTDSPDWQAEINANGIYELTKYIETDSNDYKVIEGTNWSDPNYPYNGNAVLLLDSACDVTFLVNIENDLVMHTNPVLTGSFFDTLGGTNWSPQELMGEMADNDNDQVYQLNINIPAGDWQCKVTLNNSWNQNTGDDIDFHSYGNQAIQFVYDFTTNTTTVIEDSPSDTLWKDVYFVVNDAACQQAEGFYLKGSFDENGLYDPQWNGGNEISAFYDDGTHGDETAGDHIWTCMQTLVVLDSATTWEWGINNAQHQWIDGNWPFYTADTLDLTLTYDVPCNLPKIVLTEIMYNGPEAGTDTTEFIEIYNNDSLSHNLSDWFIDDAFDFVFPDVDIAPGEYLLISLDSTAMRNTFDVASFEWASGGLSNGGESISLKNADSTLIFSVTYGDGGDWPSAPDGGGPSLTFCVPSLQNDDPANWSASVDFAAINAAGDTIWASPGAGCAHMPQLFSLATGWNMLSFNVQPGQTDLMEILQPLIDDGKLIKVIDGNGDIIQEMPWGWVNNIGDMTIGEGYLLKLSDDGELMLQGDPVALPMAIELPQGWSIIGYPSSQEVDAQQLFQSLIDEGKLIKVMDEAGNILQQMPWGWVNNIGNIQPGKAYYVKLLQSGSIVIE